MRNITVEFDMGVDFSVEGDVALDGATVNANQENATLDSFIAAFKCDGFGSNEDNSALAPNAELSLCITSMSDEVRIDKIVSMASRK